MGNNNSPKQLSRTHFTVQEVADQWGVSPNFVRRLVWDKRIECTRFGRSVRIPVSTVEEFVEAQTVQAS